MYTQKHTRDGFVSCDSCGIFGRITCSVTVKNKNTCKHVIHNCTLHVQYIYNYMYMYTQSHTHVLYMHDTTACVHHIHVYTVHHTHVHVPSSFFSSGCFNCRNSLSILEKKQHNTHVLIYTVQCI